MRMNGASRPTNAKGTLQIVSAPSDAHARVEGFASRRYVRNEHKTGQPDIFAGRLPNPQVSASHNVCLMPVMRILCLLRKKSFHYVHKRAAKGLPDSVWPLPLGLRFSSGCRALCVL